MATAVPRNPQRSGEGRTFRITGLDCAEEVALLKRAVGPRVGGDLHLTFDLLNGRMTVADAAAAVPDSEITAAIRGAGYEPHRIGGDDAATEREREAREREMNGLRRSLLVAAVLTPPDPVSQIGLAVPTILLYEISIWTARIVERQREERRLAREKAQASESTPKDNEASAAAE